MEDYTEDYTTEFIIMTIFNIILALGIGLVAFGILSAIFNIHIWVISISIGIMLLTFAFSFVVEIKCKKMQKNAK